MLQNLVANKGGNAFSLNPVIFVSRVQILQCFGLLAEKSFQIGNARNSAGLAFLEQLDLGKQIIQPVIQGRCG